MIAGTETATKKKNAPAQEVARMTMKQKKVSTDSEIFLLFRSFFLHCCLGIIAIAIIFFQRGWRSSWKRFVQHSYSNG